MDLTCHVGHNGFAAFDAQFRAAVSRGVRGQAFETEGDVKAGIVKYDVIDTGNMLNSTMAKMTGPSSAEVATSAESAAGFPYPVVQNYGSAHVPASPFFTEAELKAERNFPRRMKREVEAI